MYIPSSNIETRVDRLHGLVREHPLGTLVTHGDEGLCADHIPFEVSAPTADAPFGVLRAHVARANPLWSKDGQAMVVFQGYSAYVAPSLYEEKAVSGKVVPTWNYMVMHAHGPLKAIEDPAWLLALLGRLTTQHESPRAHPWAIEDAPRDFIDKLLLAIVGLEIPIRRMEGKFKLSQNRSEGDQRRIAEDTGLNQF